MVFGAWSKGETVCIRLSFHTEGCKEERYPLVFHKERAVLGIGYRCHTDAGYPLSGEFRKDELSLYSRRQLGMEDEGRRLQACSEKAAPEAYRDLREEKHNLIHLSSQLGHSCGV